MLKSDMIETQLFREAADAPGCVNAQQVIDGVTIQEIGNALRKCSPKFITTIARGSSDHAATYLKYLVETTVGISVASYAPSISSVYGAMGNYEQSACFAISQSGKSPDIVAAATTAKQNGALVIALVNNPDSPLGEVADFVAPLNANPETAVAASKSYIASLAMIARIVAAWTPDVPYRDDLEVLPSKLAEAWEIDWASEMPTLQQTDNIYVLGRGIGLGVAQEAALKFKETCRIHAEAFSSAEVLHGPAAIVKPGFKVLAFTQQDRTQDGMVDTLRKLIEMGATVSVTGLDIQGATKLSTISLSPQLQPLLIAQSFYRMVNHYSISLGCNPDAPPNLRKVTETV